MKTNGLAGIPLYPELRNCPAPSAPRILEIFDDVKRHQLISQDQVVQTFQPNSHPCNSRSSTSCTSQPASTPDPLQWGDISTARSAERQFEGMSVVSSRSVSSPTAAA